MLRAGDHGCCPGRGAPGQVSHGLVVNTAAVLLTGYGERARRAGRAPDRHAGGHTVSAGFVYKAATRLDSKLQVNWRDGNHPGYILGCWVHDHAGQIWQPWNGRTTSPKGRQASHQAVPGYWHTQATLARWCCVRSYLDSATAHGLTAIEAVSIALTGKPGAATHCPHRCLNRRSRTPVNRLGLPGRMTNGTRPIARHRPAAATPSRSPPVRRHI